MNRLLGILFTLAAIAAMVLAILNYGEYRSMLFTDRSASSEAIAPLDSTEEIIEATDTTSVSTTELIISEESM